MRVRNDPEDTNSGTYGELIRLQSEFYARLTEETLKYLRRLQATASPAAPGTVVMPEGKVALEGSGAVGQAVALRIEIENRQRVHCMVTPMLSPLVHASGATWFPSASFDKSSVLLAPEQVDSIHIEVGVPSGTPEGAFRGVLLLQGFRDNAIPVTIHVTNAESPSVKTPSAKKKIPVKKPSKGGTK